MTTIPAQRQPGSAPLGFDASDPAFIRNPYLRYQELRDAPDLHRSNEGLWILTRHADVLAALRDPRLSSNPRHVDPARRPQSGGNLLAMADDTISLMLTADAPDHTRLRRLANKAFTPRAVESLRPRVVELVDGLLDAVDGGGEFDFMNAVAEPLPVMVICELLGVPADDWDQFKPWSSAIARVLDPNPDEAVLGQAIPAVMGFVQYFGALIEERRADPRNDLLSALIAAEAEGDKLTPGELFAMVILLFIAGHETTTNLLGNGTLALLRNPDQFKALIDDPSLSAPGTDELLRYDSPVQITARTAIEDVDLNGIHLAKGDGVMCGLAAANRDPRFVDEPERLLLHRGTPTHVAFGNGMHHCLGAPLARLEGQVVFERAASRFPGLSLVDDSPVYRDHFVLRGLAALPVNA